MEYSVRGYRRQLPKKDWWGGGIERKYCQPSQQKGQEVISSITATLYCIHNSSQYIHSSTEDSMAHQNPLICCLSIIPGQNLVPLVALHHFCMQSDVEWHTIYNALFSIICAGKTTRYWCPFLAGFDIKCRQRNNTNSYYNYSFRYIQMKPYVTVVAE